MQLHLAPLEGLGSTSLSRYWVILGPLGGLGSTSLSRYWVILGPLGGMLKGVVKVTSDVVHNRREVGPKSRP